MKKNALIILVFVFLFRTIIIAANYISFNVNNANYNSSLQPVSLTEKRLAHVGTNNSELIKVFSFIELAEEETENEENHVKSDIPIILFFALTLSLIAALIQKSHFGFDVIKYNLSRKKYLSISVLRI